MKEILVITQKDVDPTYTENGNVDYKIRHATRAVLSDTNGKVALLHSTAHNYYKLPGGGVEPGEGTLVALARELLEEVGAVAEVTGEVGRTQEWRVNTDGSGLHQISEAFTARVAGQIGKPELTDEERREGFEVVWADDISHALALFSTGLEKLDPRRKFMTLRDKSILNEVRSNTL